MRLYEELCVVLMLVFDGDAMNRVSTIGVISFEFSKNKKIF